MGKPPDSSGGQPATTQQTQFTLADILAVFDQRSDQAKPLTASDVMDAVGCSRRTAHNKLGELVETGALETRKVGARSRVWWIPMPHSADHTASETAPQRDPAVETQIAVIADHCPTVRSCYTGRFRTVQGRNGLGRI